MFGATESSAELVAAALAEGMAQSVPCRDVTWFDLAELADYDLVVLGAATWNIGQLPYGWADKLADLERFGLSGKTVALFGTGDQVGYPDTYLDALGMVADAARDAGAVIVGSWPTAGYAFTASRAVEGARFVGLALDDDNQPDLTATRIADWVHLVLDEVEQAGSRGSAPSMVAVPG